MSDFTVGQKVKIKYCYVREELSGIETEITEAASNDYRPLDFADNYELPAYRVAVDPDFRPVADQLSAAG